MNGFEEVWAKALFGRPKQNRPAPCRPVPFERENVSGLGLWQQTITLAQGGQEALEWTRETELASQAHADTRDREVLLEEIRVLRSIISEIEDAKRAETDPGYMKVRAGALVVDYSEPDLKAWTTPDPRIEELIANSRVVSVNGVPVDPEPGLSPGAAIARALRFA